MLDLTNLNKTRDLPRRYNVAIQYKGVEIKDQKKSTPGEDLVVGYLMHDIHGLQATENEEGVLTTEVKARIKHPANKKFSNEPLAPYHLPRKYGFHTPIQEGGVVIIENGVYNERTGTIEGTYLRVMARDPQTEHVHAAMMMSVHRERYSEVDGEREYRQNRVIYLVGEAVAVTSPDQFKKALADILVDRAEVGGGRPGALLRVVSLENPDERSQTQINAAWDAENSRMVLGDEMVATWMSDENNASWVNQIIAKAGTEDANGFLIELIPTFTYKTGVKSLPSKSEKGHDDSRNFAYPVKDENGNFVVDEKSGEVRTRIGVAPGHMAIKRMDKDGIWFATETYRVDQFGPVYAADELVTANTPEHVVKHFDAAAEQRRKDISKMFTDKKKSQEEAQASADDIAFGEPEQAAGSGLTPR